MADADCFSVPSSPRVEEGAGGIKNLVCCQPFLLEGCNETDSLHRER